MLKIELLVIAGTLFFSLPVSSDAHPQINYTQSFVKFHTGHHMHLEEPEKPRSCEVIGNCLIIPLVLVIVVIMAIVIYFVRKEDYS